MSVKKKKVLNLLFQKNYRPVTLQGIQTALQLTDDRDVQELYKTLDNLEREGSIIKTSQGRYTPLRGMGLLVGTIQAHAQGYAFLLPESPGESDVFIPPEKTGGAMHKDRVIVRIVKEHRGKQRREGEVTRILKRNNGNIVGVFQGNKSKGVVLPDDPHLSQEVNISALGSTKPRSGDKVLVKITRWPDSSNNNPRGTITEVIGPADDAEVEITCIQKKYDLPTGFPSAVLKEARRLEEKDIEEAVHEEDRRDLCSLPMVTIDDDDAKDLDDAVSLEKIADGGYRLGVHIADVSYYVREGSALDREAAKRATSVYLPDRVVPMFPPQLSNGICSLNPGDPRLAISVFMDINRKGELKDYSFSPSVIKSDERMTYEDVNNILRGDKTLEEKYSDFAATFREMHYLARTLKEKRLKEGALDFNFPEAKIKLDEDGKPVDIQVRRGGEAESIIEEFMLQCNMLIATHFHQKKAPFIYRVHERPEGDKLFILRDFLSLFDIKFKGELSKISPRQYQEILKQVEDTPLEKVISFVLLRSLPQAHYSEAEEGHFGLSAQHYTHFTSPIRRYPDLLVHRILRTTLKGRLSSAESRKLASRLPRLAQHCSEQERIAIEAEREALDLKKTEFMEGKEGTEYSGVISGVTSFGFFVELDNTVEGLVHVTRMDDDYYYYDEKRYSLVGEHSGKIYRLGDTVKVRLEKVDKEMRSVHFAPLS